MLAQDEMNTELELIHEPFERRTIVPANDVVEVIPFLTEGVGRFAPLPSSLDPMFCRHAMGRDASISAYIPLLIPRSYPLLVGGGNHLFIQICIDGYATHLTRSHSTTAVYFAIANMPREHYSKLENIHLLMLLTPGVDLHEALAPVRRDLLRLQNGIDTFDIKFPHQGARPLTATAANFPADLPQVPSYHNQKDLSSSFFLMNVLSSFLNSNSERLSRDFRFIRRRRRMRGILEEVQRCCRGEVG
jgi:hypothetical protein